MIRIFGVALAAGALASIDCVPDRTEARSASPAAPHVVALSATDGAFEAPDTIEAGWTTFHFANRGSDIHYAHFVRLDSGKTAAELVGAYAEAIRTSSARPKWVVRFGGPGGATPGDSAVATQQLEPGTYVLICPVEDVAGNPHFGKGEFKTVIVRAANSNTTAQQAAPASTSTIQLTDFAFAIDSGLTAGTHTFRVTNAGMEAHDLVVLKLAPGVTADAVMKAMNPERARRPGEAAEPPPPFESLASGAGGIAAIKPGMDVYFTTTLSRGDYLLLCMATAPDGRSHIEHGMVQQVRIQ